jgi:F-type H+-transporting ATPase subunit alpha
MKQKQYSPLSVAEMALSLFAANEGFIDPVPVNKVVDYEEALHDYARSNNQALLDKIDETGDYNDDIAASLREVCEGFAEKGAY